MSLGLQRAPLSGGAVGEWHGDRGWGVMFEWRPPALRQGGRILDPEFGNAIELEAVAESAGRRGLHHRVLVHKFGEDLEVIPRSGR
jgi:hypothetical protein